MYNRSLLLGSAFALAALLGACSSPSLDNVEFIKRGEGPRVEDDQVMFSALRFAIGSTDSVLYNGTATPLVFDDSLADPGTFIEALGILSLGDSVRVTLPANSFYAENGETVPPFMSPEEMLTFDIRVDSIVAKEEVEARANERQLAQYIMQSQMRMGMMLADSAIVAQMELEAPIIAQYMEDNGLVATENKSGIQVIVTEMGTGEVPPAGHRLTMNYAGQLFDGTYFDTNDPELAKEAGLFNPQRPYDPFKFELIIGNVIPGWHIGIEGLPVGTKAILLIPSSLAYGTGGNSSIPPNSPLRFDIEVLDAEPLF